METKHTKEYAEKMYLRQLDNYKEVGFVDGYMKAIEETAAPELLEALEFLVYELTGEQECEEELEKGLGAHLLNKVLVAKYAIKKAKGE